MKRSVIILGVMFFLGGTGLCAAQDQATLPFKPGEVVVGYKNARDREISSALYKKSNAAQSFNLFGSTVIQKVEVTPLADKALVLKIEIPQSLMAIQGSDESFHRRLIDDLAIEIKRRDPRVKYVTPYWLMRIPDEPKTKLNEKALKQLLAKRDAPKSGLPNDPAFTQGLHWHYQALPQGMNAVGAWRTTTGDKKIVIAVVDSGLHVSHPDISPTNVLPGYSFVSDEGRGPNPLDPRTESHGTHVAGTIGIAGTNNQVGMSGLSWAASVLPVRVIGESGGGNPRDIADGILWAAGLPVAGVPNNPSPADIINLSLGAPFPCEGPAFADMRSAIEKALNAGAVIVVAAGNEGIDVKGVAPAGCSRVISVAAHDMNGKLTHYSNFGDVTIMAPGGDTGQRDSLGQPAGIWSITGGTPLGMVPFAGTSMAAPHVSGAIALALAAHPDWRRKPDLIAKIVADTAAPLQAGACDHPCGHGQLDAQRLVEYKLDDPAVAISSAEVAKNQAVNAEKAVSGKATGAAQDGAWLLGDGSGILRISGDQWTHPSKGSAVVTLNQSDLTVRYPQTTAVKCEYRLSSLGNGAAIVLAPINALQPDDYCPSGKLLSAR